jgi:methylmalonyl-CoA mutase
MAVNEFTIADDFPPVSYAQWRALVEEDLQGAPFEKKLLTHTYEGIDIQPIYTRADHPDDDDPLGFPGLPPFVRGAQPLGAVHSGWDLRQEFAEPDLAAANRAILDDVAGGVTSVLLRLDAAAREGLDPDDRAAQDLANAEGVMAYTADDLEAVLEGVPLERIAVALDAGAAYLPAAGLLATVWRRRGLPPDRVRGAFNADPWSVLASTGRLPQEAKSTETQLGELAAWTATNLPQVTSIGVDTSAYHHAGATAAQDLAIAMATGVSYLRAMAGAGLEIDAAAKQVLFRIRVGTHHFLALAKLRAARRLWRRVVDGCGGSPESGGMRIHAELSDRVLTARDPYVNILRNTVGVFAAGLAGADVITSVPFDRGVGLPRSFSRRVARNTVLILQDEASLNRVIDPAGGSWFLDTITEQIAQQAWTIFQEAQRQGGMPGILTAGWVAQQIEAAYAPRAHDIARRKEGITGVSEFPNVSEELIKSPRPDGAALLAAASERVKKVRRNGTASASLSSSPERTASVLAAAQQGATIGQLASGLGFRQAAIEATPLPDRTFAQPFEELRDASDAWRMIHGRRPTVFLANLGSVAHHTARATFSKNFFEAGGFEVVTSDSANDVDSAATAFAQSGSAVAVICSSDKLYPDLVPKMATKLKAAGARTVILAGNPSANESAWRAAGVDRFIFVKCEVLGTLRELLREEGVLAS